jgi:hypothetical protein
MSKKFDDYEEMDIPDSIEDIKREPIVKPLLDYQKAFDLIKKEDASESHYLNQKMEALTKLLDTGIYANSLIALKYKDVLEVYQRLLFIYQKYSEMVEKRIRDINDIVKKYYITIEEHKRIMEQKKYVEIEVPEISVKKEEKKQKEAKEIKKKEVKDIDG